MKWRKGKDFGGCGDHLVAEAPEGRYIIVRSLRRRVDPWYEMFVENAQSERKYLDSDWVVRKLKERVPAGTNPTEKLS